MYRLLTTLWVLSIAININAQFQPTTTGEIIEHSLYSLSYSEKHEQAEWVYYKLTPSLVNGSQNRTDDFRPDPKISSGSASLADYIKSGYDRGHLCPAGDMKVSHTAMSETFYMSNMSPQEPSFNRGIWKKLEATVRNWAITEESIHVVTAGILSSNTGHIGPNKVSVPNYYYKVVYAPAAQKMIAFILPNKKSSQALQSFVVPVDEVESRTGIDFFPQLDDSLENKLEAQSYASQWSFLQYTSSPSNKQHSPTSSTTGSQCKAISKSTGKRCSRKAAKGSNYCWQHQK